MRVYPFPHSDRCIEIPKELPQSVKWLNVALYQYNAVFRKAQEKGYTDWPERPDRRLK